MPYRSLGHNTEQRRQSGMILPRYAMVTPAPVLSKAEEDGRGGVSTIRMTVIEQYVELYIQCTTTFVTSCNYLSSRTPHVVRCTT